MQARLEPFKGLVTPRVLEHAALGVHRTHHASKRAVQDRHSLHKADIRRVERHHDRPSTFRFRGPELFHGHDVEQSLHLFTRHGLDDDGSHASTRERQASLQALPRRAAHVQEGETNVRPMAGKPFPLHRVQNAGVARSGCLQVKIEPSHVRNLVQCRLPQMPGGFALRLEPCLQRDAYPLLVEEHRLGRCWDKRHHRKGDGGERGTSEQSSWLRSRATRSHDQRRLATLSTRPFAALDPRRLLGLRSCRNSNHTDRNGVDHWPCIDHHWHHDWHRQHALRREDNLPCR